MEAHPHRLKVRILAVQTEIKPPYKLYAEYDK
jgi:hypothetical protein